MRKEHRPHGKGLTAWEAGILKIRAFEMILVIFYMEDLKRFILGSIEVTDQLHGLSRLTDGKSKAGGGKKLELARALLVSEGVIDRAESDELKALVDYRNIIGHTVHKLTVDIGAYSYLAQQAPTTFESIPLYDYNAAKRAKALRQKVIQGMTKNFVLRMSFDSLAFEAAEKTYTKEIERMKRRANQSIEKANTVIAETNRIINAVPKWVMYSAQPGHPGCVKENGTLSRRGAACAFQLFDANAPPLAVAYLMKISLRSAKHWFAKWNASKA